MKKIIAIVMIILLSAQFMSFSVSAEYIDHYVNYFDDENAFADSCWTIDINANMTREINETLDESPGSAKISVPAQHHDSVRFGGLYNTTGQNFRISFEIKLAGEMSPCFAELIINNPLQNANDVSIGKVVVDSNNFIGADFLYTSASGIDLKKLYLKIGDGNINAEYYIDNFEINPCSENDKLLNSNFECVSANKSDYINNWMVNSTLMPVNGGNILDKQTTFKASGYSGAANKNNLSLNKPDETCGDGYVAIYNTLATGKNNIYPSTGVQNYLCQQISLSGQRYYHLSAWVKGVLAYNNETANVTVTVEDLSGNLLNSDFKFEVSGLGQNWFKIDKTIYVEQSIEQAVVKISFVQKIPLGIDGLSLAGRVISSSTVSGDVLYRYAVDELRLEPIFTEPVNSYGNIEQISTGGKIQGWSLDGSLPQVDKEPSAIEVGTSYLWYTHADYLSGAFGAKYPKDNVYAGKYCAIIKNMVNADADHPVNYPQGGMKIHLSGENGSRFSVEAGKSYNVSAYAMLRLNNFFSTLPYTLSIRNNDGVVLGQIQCQMEYNNMTKSAGVIEIQQTARDCYISLDIDIPRPHSNCFNAGGQLIKSISHHFLVDCIYVCPIGETNLSNGLLDGQLALNSYLMPKYSCSNETAINHYEYRWLTARKPDSKLEWVVQNSGITTSKESPPYYMTNKDMDCYIKYTVRGVTSSGEKTNKLEIQTDTSMTKLDIKIEKPNVVQSDEIIDLPITLVNNDSSKGSAASIVAFYNGNQLKDVKYKTQAGLGTGDVVDLSIKGIKVPQKCNTAKLFIWDSLNNCNPILQEAKSFYVIDNSIASSEDSHTVYQKFYVDGINGNDAYNGSKELPFKTIEHAQEAVRAINKNMNGDIYVYLKSGTFELSSPLIFTSLDSAYNGYHIFYQSYGDGEAVLSGGRNIVDWQQYDVSKNIWRAKANGINTRQFYVNGVRAVRARSDEGLTNPQKTSTGYICDNTEMIHWHNIHDIEFVYYEYWTQPRNHPDTITAENGKAMIKMLEPGWSLTTNKGMTSVSYPKYIENAYELLDQPGEWYLNKAEDYFYYIPRYGEDMSSANVTVPVLEQLIKMQGDSLSDPVENIYFNGIGFRYTTWLLPSTSMGIPDAQNNLIRAPSLGYRDALAPAAVMIEGGNAIDFRACTFSGLGINGLQYLRFSKNSNIVGCKFFDISGSAINIGETSFSEEYVTNPPSELYLTKNFDVYGNLIHDIGVDYGSASAISLGFPVNVRIAKNEIYNTTYSGMHIGYGWDNYEKTVLDKVCIYGNYIHNTSSRLYDSGGVYTIGATGASNELPNLIAGNYFKDHLNAWAPIYHDQGSSYWLSNKNVIDLRNVEKWTGYEADTKLWLNISATANVEAKENYTTEPNYQYPDGREKVTKAYYVPDLTNNQEVVDLINNSGLPYEYHYLGDTKPLFLKDIDIKRGDSIDPKLIDTLNAWCNQNISPTGLEYTSDNPTIGSVDENGVIKAENIGTATVRGKYKNGLIDKEVVVIVNVI